MWNLSLRGPVRFGGLGTWEGEALPGKGGAYAGQTGWGGRCLDGRLQKRLDLKTMFIRNHPTSEGCWAWGTDGAGEARGVPAAAGRLALDLVSGGLG